MIKSSNEGEPTELILHVGKDESVVINDWFDEPPPDVFTLNVNT